MSAEQIKIRIEGGQASILYRNEGGISQRGPSLTIPEARKTAKSFAQQVGCVYGEDNLGLIEQSRQARATMVGGTEDGGVNDVV